MTMVDAYVHGCEAREPQPKCDQCGEPRASIFSIAVVVYVNKNKAKKKTRA